jgi:hypothetical protein
MLTRLIVDLYAWIIEIALWCMLLVAGVAGYHYAVPLLTAAGGIPENETAWAILGSIVFVLAAFLLLVIVTGPFLVLVDIRKSVKLLELKNSGRIGEVQVAERVQAGERKEPSL